MKQIEPERETIEWDMSPNVILISNVCNKLHEKGKAALALAFFNSACDILNNFTTIAFDAMKEVGITLELPITSTIEKEELNPESLITINKR